MISSILSTIILSCISPSIIAIKAFRLLTVATLLKASIELLLNSGSSLFI